MNGTVLTLTLLAAALTCGYLRAPLKQTAMALGGIVVAFAIFGSVPWWGLVLAALLCVPIFALTQQQWRQSRLTGPIFDKFKAVLPPLSETERVALAAGTVNWDRELFSGKPDFERLSQTQWHRLSAEELAFLDGPCEEVAEMVDDWQVNHELADLSEPTWQYLGDKGFFGMIIPKRYGGLEFSATAHSAVLKKLSSKSVVLATTVAVPNSLGPAELLLHYGTEEQKDHYLPRLAKGKEIPCFGLTGPTAGSDATSIPDIGYVCEGQWQGEKVLGVRLTFDKRYITLAPVATVVGLAFQLRDPDGLLGGASDLGITLALVPRSTPGLEIGKRHIPLNVPFHNGPIRGRDVFVPLSYIIGGPEMAGQGWRMLVECLSVGRAISLPSTAAGGIQAGAFATGAYSRIRQQFNLPIGRFEGVQAPLARIGGYAYATTALSRMTAAAVDRGERPAVPSAIAKYHATEMGRQVAADAMDIHGGKGVILGPRNYLGRSWMAAPISITVEGANIMTRSLMIFGQGAIRCHPHVLAEMSAAEADDLAAFDTVFWSHVGATASNACRALVLSFCAGALARRGSGSTAKYYGKLARYSAALSISADVAMSTLGAKLKFKELLSARLGDVLSQLYIASAILRRFEEDGKPQADLPLVIWALEDCFAKTAVALDSFLRNFPARPAAWVLRSLVLPLGIRDKGPSDSQGRAVAELMMHDNPARTSLTADIYKTRTANNALGQLDETLELVIQAEPLEKRLRKALNDGLLQPDQPATVLQEAVNAEILTGNERDLVARTRAAVAEIIAVDEFDSEYLKAGARPDERPEAVQAPVS